MKKRTVILRLSGKAEEVFAILRYYCVNWGQMTLGEILTRHEQGKQFPTFVSK